MLRLGIVGLPNVGKSTLFNALTSAGVLAANYPFATKDPNVGRVNVPDPRLDVLAKIVEPQRTVPAAVESVDPVRDREVIEFELALADLASVEKRLDRVKRAAKTGDKEALAELPALEKAHAAVSNGTPLWEAALTDDEKTTLAPLSMLTTKPVLYAANVTDAELTGDEGAHLQTLRAAVG